MGYCHQCWKPGHYKARCPDRGKQGGSRRDNGPTVSGKPGSSGALGGAGVARSSEARSPASGSAVAQRPASRARASVQGKFSISHRLVHMAAPEPESSPTDSRKERIATCVETLAALGAELVGSEDSREDERRCWRRGTRILVECRCRVRCRRSVR